MYSIRQGTKLSFTMVKYTVFFPCGKRNDDAATFSSFCTYVNIRSAFVFRLIIIAWQIFSVSSFAFPPKQLFRFGPLYSLRSPTILDSIVGLHNFARIALLESNRYSLHARSQVNESYCLNSIHSKYTRIQCWIRLERFLLVLLSMEYSCILCTFQSIAIMLQF